MITNDFELIILTDKTPSEVFPTLLDVRSWWSGFYNETFEGNSEQPGDEFTFSAGDGAHYTKQKMTELVPNKKVSWLVTEANLSFVEDTKEWIGTEISFEVERENDKTKITFTHKGLIPDFECYSACSTAWHGYINNRLLKILKYEN